MTTATIRRKRTTKKTCRLLIEYAAPFSARVDRKNRIIRGVKVVGLKSGNSVRVVGIPSDETYEYLPSALKAAIPMYEGVVVNLDHPDFAYDGKGERHAVSETKNKQRFGRLIHVHFVESKGLFADLEYLGSHPQAKTIIEAIERMPDTVVLSHNARGNVVRQNGKFVVDKIESVRSVDLLAGKGGTNRSIFESLTKGNPMTKTVRRISQVFLNSKLTPRQAVRRIVSLLENDATGVKKDNTILITEFVGGVQQLADDQHLSNADFIEAAGMMLNALEKAMGSEINDSPSQLDSLAEEIKTDERYTTMGVLNRPHLDLNRDADFRFSKAAVESHLKDQRRDRTDRSVGVKDGKTFTESFLQPSPQPRYISLVEYEHRQKQAFKQLS